MEDDFSTIIQPKRGWFDINIKELWNYKYLISLFVKRDFTANYKQTILGPMWFLLQPLLTTIVFTIIFGNVAKLPTGGLPPFLFYFAGITCWNYFATCLTKTSDTFIANANIFGKVYFPRLTVPVSTVLTSMITFCLQFVMLMCLVLFYWIRGSEITMSFKIMIVPLLLVQMATLGLGCGIIVSSMTTRYRDLAMLVGFATQLWMYITPVAYSLDMFSSKWQTLLYLNPMTAIVDNFRYLVMGIGNFNYFSQIISIIITFIILTIGVIMFSRVEKNFMDTI